MALSAVGQWSTNPAVNNAINIMSGEQAIPKIATCPSGDTYIGFFSSESGNYNVRLQRLDVQGNELWASGGILISSHPQMSWLTDWDMTADNANHAILAFQDIRSGGNNNVVAYRIAPDGSFAWGADGIALSNSTAFDASPKVRATAAGNAVFAWQADEVTIIQKVSPGGTLLWGSSGITLSGTPRYTWPQVLPVGSDDVILKYFEDTGPVNAPTRHVYAQRYDTDGDPVWATPTAISTAGGISAWTQIFPFINDGSDGFYIAWHDDRDNNQIASAFVQHVGSDGSVLFTTNGVEVSTSGSTNHFYPKIALPPGSSDIYVFWNEMNALQSQQGLYGQKVSSSGALLWPATGQVFIALSTTSVYPIGAGHTPTDVVLFYDENVGGLDTHLKAMRIDGNGGYVWSPAIKTICSVSSEKVHAVVNDYANGQWILSWEDDRNADRDIYAQNILLNGDLGPQQIGTIEGTVTLVGGTGDVTDVSVTAGDASTSPDATGFYTLDVTAGTYEVTAMLVGYEADTVPGVVVAVNQTTPGVDLILNALPTGFVTGNVSLTGGPGDVTDVVVSAGYHSCNPDTDGNYTMEVEIGIYDMTALLSGYVPDTSFGIVILEGMTTGNVDFELSPVPTTGFIEGMVELQNGAGDVTQVEVTADGVTVNPDITGYYIMEITAGTYDVSASLTGFYTQVVQGVVVEVSQTTTDVDFFLLQVPDAGYVAGDVILVNGTGDVTQAVVSAGSQFTYPSANGHYFLTLAPGTYTVMASHPYALSDSVTGIVVEAGVTVSDVDFELEIVKGDLVCKAMDTYGTLLNDVEVEITGPDSVLTGIITGDSLMFSCISYGMYDGIAWMPDEDPVSASSELGENGHEILFVFDLTGIRNTNGHMKDLKAYPNPFSGYILIEFEIKEAEDISVRIYSQAGTLERNLGDLRSTGQVRMQWDGTNDQGNKIPAGVYYIRLESESGTEAMKVIFTP